MSTVVPIVVFSDADGIFVAPRAASLARASRALNLLAREQVSLVLYSSKTRAELELIQQELGIHYPFVAEGGSAVFIPRGHFGFPVPNAREVAGYEAVEFGLPYTTVVEGVRSATERLGVPVLAFSELSVDDVAREQGLSLLQARLAKLREYVEPFRLLDAAADVRHRLARALAASHLRSVRRGRWEHAGAPTDCIAAVTLLRQLYRRAFGAVFTIGLADAAADERLLSLMDRQVIVQDDEQVSGAVDVAEWAEAIVDLVDEVRIQQSGAALRRPAFRRAHAG
jgi:mannosyl-3-phosphoglycerate phosphatase